MKLLCTLVWPVVKACCPSGAAAPSRACPSGCPADLRTQAFVHCRIGSPFIWIRGRPQVRRVRFPMKSAFHFNVRRLCLHEWLGTRMHGAVAAVDRWRSRVPVSYKCLPGCRFSQWCGDNDGFGFNLCVTELRIFQECIQAGTDLTCVSPTSGLGRWKLAETEPANKRKKESPYHGTGFTMSRPLPILHLGRSLRLRWKQAFAHSPA